MHFVAHSTVRCSAVRCGAVKCTGHACNCCVQGHAICAAAGFCRARGCRASGQGSRRVAEAAIAARKSPLGAHLARCRGRRRRDVEASRHFFNREFPIRECESVDLFTSELHSPSRSTPAEKTLRGPPFFPVTFLHSYSRNRMIDPAESFPVL